MRRAVTTVGAAGLWLAFFAAGCSNVFEPACARGQFVTVGLSTNGTSGVMYPADVAFPWASLAKGQRSEPSCSTLVYATWTGAQFSWSSGNPDVLSVVGGKVTAKAPGSAWLRAETEGKSDSIEVFVAPRVVTLTIIASPAQAKVGDTVVVKVEPRDSSGTLVPGASLYGPIFVTPTPYPKWLAGSTTFGGRFVMETAEPTTIVSIAPHFQKELRTQIIVRPP